MTLTGDVPSTWWQDAVAPEEIRLGGCNSLSVAPDLLCHKLWGDNTTSSWARSLRVLDLTGTVMENILLQPFVLPLLRELWVSSTRHSEAPDLVQCYYIDCKMIEALFRPCRTIMYKH
jgi:hypothetical protein